MSTDTPSTGLSSEPFVWVILPLVSVFAIGACAMFLWSRQKQRRRAEPCARSGDDGVVVAGGAHVRYRQGVSWSPRSDARQMDEGLNELGEAPPPYDSKTPPALGRGHHESGTEPRHAETATRHLEHPVRPPAAHVTAAGGASSS
ncbi:uncharacterized protein UV8b_07474 [Ustilaginoidea virens]|uniref:Uncharacterized protein n=1 Tax=Ustilaginoidea virens TaxID=1159556 RepID=A0A063BYU7_USTVR|nr:uncharacterized protein UV8b_07474 [Ustilaginoidea virens]QUC23233.1 hypothetical protein UV8b_07474 [Ustilaginoidea virens]GAO14316.1 hypothetical protein UVI_02033920 [Ustilaginoidea virens]